MLIRLASAISIHQYPTQDGAALMAVRFVSVCGFCSGTLWLTAALPIKIDHNQPCISWKSSAKKFRIAHVFTNSPAYLSVPPPSRSMVRNFGPICHIHIHSPQCFVAELKKQFQIWVHMEILVSLFPCACQTLQIACIFHLPVAPQEGN